MRGDRGVKMWLLLMLPIMIVVLTRKAGIGLLLHAPTTREPRFHASMLPPDFDCTSPLPSPSPPPPPPPPRIPNSALFFSFLPYCLFNSPLRHPSLTPWLCRVTLECCIPLEPRVLTSQNNGPFCRHLKHCYHNTRDSR